MTAPMKADRLLLTAGGLASFTALVHIVAGTPEIQAPLLAAAMPPPVAWLLLACWHLVSVALTVSGLALLWCVRPTQRGRSAALAGLIALMWLGFAAVFVAVGLAWRGPAGLALLPQWTLLALVGVLAAWAARPGRQR